MESESGDRHGQLLGEGRQDPGFHLELPRHIVTLREPEHPFAIHVEGDAVAALTERADPCRGERRELCLDQRSGKGAVHLLVFMLAYSI